MLVDWATHKAANYACTHWHYSKKVPKSKLLKLGVWEGGAFVGVVIFGVGANKNLGREFGLIKTEVCELVRIALTTHKTQVSRIVKICLQFLKRHASKIRLVISYADPTQGHIGAIYQAGNWIYVGKSQAQREVIVNGKLMHKRVANLKFGPIKGLQKGPLMWKYKYVYLIDRSLAKKVHSKRYPKRATSIENDAIGLPAGKGRCDSDRGAPS